MSAAATTLLRTEHAPLLPPEGPGVRIAAGPRPAHDSPLVLHGAYRIPWAEADRIQPPRHRALVLVVSSGPIHLVAAPFREQILFEDDERATREGPEGHFTIDVFALAGENRAGRYHLFVSLGAHVSNVVEVSVR